MILYHYGGGTLPGFRPGVSDLVTAGNVSTGDLTRQHRDQLAEWLAGDRQPGDQWSGSDAYEYGTAQGLPRLTVRAIRYVHVMLTRAAGPVHEASRQLEQEHPWTVLDVAPYPRDDTDVSDWEAAASPEELEWRDRVGHRAGELARVDFSAQPLQVWRPEAAKRDGA